MSERHNAERFLHGLENGTLSTDEAAMVAEELDPVLVYLIINFLRAVHPASDPAASPILERVVKVTTAYPAVVKRYREGENDPVTQWFEADHEYRSYRGLESTLIDRVIDKLES